MKRSKPDRARAQSGLRRGRSVHGPFCDRPGGDWAMSRRMVIFCSTICAESHAAPGLTSSKAEPHNGTCETEVAISAESRCYPGHGHRGEPDLRRSAERHPG